MVTYPSYITALSRLFDLQLCCLVTTICPQCAYSGQPMVGHLTTKWTWLLHDITHKSHHNPARKCSHSVHTLTSAADQALTMTFDPELLLCVDRNQTQGDQCPQQGHLVVSGLV